MQVNLIAEEEITKILAVLAEMRERMGVKEEDPELDRMLKRTDMNYIEHSIINQLEKANTPLVKQLQNEFPELVKKPFEFMHLNGQNQVEHPSGEHNQTEQNSEKSQ